MKTLEELERVKQAGPDLLEALEAIVEGFEGVTPYSGYSTMTKYVAREIAREAIEKATKP
jgi:hypothetical protein